MKLHPRNGTYHLRRHVPKRYAVVESRKEVWVSLHTDSLDVARKKAPGVWDEMIDAWELKLAGQTDVAEERFEAARQLAGRRGFRFLPPEDVARLPLDEILDRLDHVYKRGKPDLREADAVLGGAPVPKVTLRGALKDYWTLARPKTKGKSPDQLRRWKNPRMKAVNNLVALIGDVPLADLTADHMLDFREWWWERIEDEGMTENSANKDFTHLGDVLKTVNTMRRLGLDLPLGGHAFKETKKGKRPPFSTPWIRDRLLAPGALDGLNLDARGILLGMVNTGARPSEIANLTAEGIRLDAEIPHIDIAPIGRTVKTANAIRQIPIAGVSLEAFRACPDGFARYRDKAGISATLNKYLRENGLMESAAHVVYSLRHSFEDRLLEAGVDERVRRDLMGHALDRQRYGEGGGLPVRAAAVAKVAL